MAESRRWKIMNNVFLVVLSIIIFFAYMDSQQIISFQTINTKQGWDLYNAHTGPAIWKTWYFVIAAIGIIWYVIYKDKSESLGIVAAGWSLIYFGTQDLLFFAFSEQTLSSIGCWADNLYPVRTISDLLGESCPTATSFLLSGFFGIVFSFYSYNWLKEAKW